MPPSASASEVLAHPAVRKRFQQLLDRLWREGTGSASRVARLMVLDAPPSMDAGEILEKGSLNQRAVLATRAALVARVHAGVGADIHLPDLPGNHT